MSILDLDVIKLCNVIAVLFSFLTFQSALFLLFCICSKCTNILKSRSDRDKLLVKGSDFLDFLFLQHICPTPSLFVGSKMSFCQERLWSVGHKKGLKLIYTISNIKNRLTIQIFMTIFIPSCWVHQGSANIQSLEHL